MSFRHICNFTLLLLPFLLASCQSPDAAAPDTTAEEPANVPDTPVPPTETAVAPEESDATWTVVVQTQEEHRPAMAAFLNPEVGITSCSEGATPNQYITADGGNSWEPVRCLHRAFGIDIVDERSIWKCGEGLIYSSEDGGYNWDQLVDPVGGSCRFISFVDDGNGWAASRDRLAATNDGGDSWHEITLPGEIKEGVNDIASISLRTPNEGYVMDFERTLYSTSDGGENWSVQTLELEDSDLDFMKMGNSSGAVRFTDDDHGLVILNLAGGGNSKLLALHTSDGGQTWESNDLPTELGPVYLSHDGVYLTVSEPGKGFTVLENQSTIGGGS